MFQKGSLLYSIFNNKCPRCHEGDFFKHKISYNVAKITALHENCSHCKLKYMLETSFFFGAMYVNYALAVALAVAVFIICKLFLGMELLHSFVAIVVVSLVLTPVTIRLSRIIWINFFVSYDEKYTSNSNKNNNNSEKLTQH